MSKFSKSALRKLNDLQKEYHNTQKEISKRLEDYLEDPNNDTAKSFAKVFRGYHGEKINLNYKNSSIIIYVESGNVNTIPSENKIKNRIENIVGKSYWEPKIFKKVFNQEGSIKELKRGMIKDLEYRVGCNIGKGFKFYLHEGKINYKEIFWDGNYKCSDLRNFFKKVEKILNS